MPKIAGPPLRKVTLNLFDSDVAWFQKRHGLGYSEVIRTVVNKHVQRHSIVERSLELNREIVDLLFTHENDGEEEDGRE